MTRRTNQGLVNQYLTWMTEQARRSPNTVYKYQLSYRIFLGTIGTTDLADVTVDVGLYLNPPVAADVTHWSTSARRFLGQVPINQAGAAVAAGLPFSATVNDWSAPTAGHR